jgi:lipopolysaccharide export system protein LptA
MRVSGIVIRMAAAVALSVACSTAYALKSDADQPIKIRARNIDANEKTGVSVYRGNVVMSQGTLRVEADRVEITFRDGRAELVQAWGQPVRMQSRSDNGEDLRGRALRVVYRGTKRLIDLYGDVELKRDSDVFASAAVHYALDDQTFSAEGSADGPASAILQPAKPQPSR